MGLITKLLSLINGHADTVDLSVNTLGVQDISISGTTLTQSGVVASFTGQVAGMSTNVTINAVNPGPIGNSISLPFNGVLTIAAEIAAWNTANPSNHAVLAAGNGGQVPNNATVINLSGGSAVSGSGLIGDFNSYTNFTPASPTIQAALAAIDVALVTAGSSRKVDKFVLDSTDESNKFVTLSFTPGIPGDTILLVEDAGNMYYGTDFEVVGNQLRWTGKLLDGILSSGDSLTVTYNT